MAQEAADLPGYQRGEPLHDSSASVVYRARRVGDGVLVVVKTAHGDAATARQLTRYQNEYELLRSLDTAGVVKAYDLVRHDGRVALVLEDVPGTSLRRWIESAVGAPLRERLEIAAKLAGVLAEVHAASVIHKDVSSHNVIYDSESRTLKLIDFGIATRLKTEENKFQAAAALEGTLAYMAPEQTGRMNRSLDYRADLYSLGVTLYELFTGVLPHESADPLEMVHFQIAGTPQPPSERRAGVPEAVSAIVMKLLQKEPEARYQSAAGVVADLATCIEMLDAQRPIEPFALASRDVVDRFEPPRRLYGRAAETRVLLESFQRTARGSVETVAISGQAGIGKTALVQEIYQPITHRRGYFVAGKFDPLQQNVPFSALVSALQDLVQQLLTESEEAIDAWRKAIHAAVHPNGRLITDVVPELALIIGPQPPVSELEALEAQNRFNLVFRSFLQVFCKREHPLVLFLDDMQWADPASLHFVTQMVTAPDTEALLLVTTYRDNEVSPNHPFMLALKQQANDGVGVRTIELQPLGTSEIAEFVADALRQDVTAAAALADIVHRKTGGNPFFLRQFLQTLYESKLIRFDANARTFCYDAAAVESASITENVADFLAAKLENLPPQTRNALRAAAAMGSRFDLRLLSEACARSAPELAADLEAAVDAGLISPLAARESVDPSIPGSPLVYGRFGFLHDRVQQAAYAMVEAAERPALHLAIGRALLAEHSESQADARLFDIVNHLNHGAALLTDPGERVRLAELNLRAGAKARDATAYDLAALSLRTAIELLGSDGWRERYELMFESHRRLAESLCLIADHAGAFDAIESALEHATSIIDRGRLCTLETSVHLMMGRIPEALACGRRAARLFDIELPEEREQVQAMLQSEIAAILEHAAAVGIENLIDLPVMDDPVKVALMEHLAHCLPAAYQSDQDTYALLCCKMVRVSFDSGNCALSARAYGSFAALLSSALGLYKDAYRFAKLGVDLAHKLDDRSVFSGVYFLWAMFASHWNKPIEESIELFRLAIQYGVQSGDHSHAGYSAARRVSHLQLRGMPLTELREDALATMELLRRIGDSTNPEFLAPRIRFIDWLQGERPHGNTLGSDAHDERECTAIIQGRGNRSFEFDWFHQLTLQRYFCGDFEAALAFAETSAGLLPFSAGFVTRAEHTLFYSLIVTALYSSAEPGRRKAFDERLKTNQEQMKVWADHCPENYGHMYLLVEAERARIARQRIEAADRYDQAIAAAREQGFTNVEALAAELAARFWFENDKPDFGKIYLDKALHAYDIWGAFGKVSDLKSEFGLDTQAGLPASVTSGSTTLGTTERADALDLATVIKANQAIASEIVLERLLATLMSIIMENAGAESAVLLLERDGEFLVEAVKTPSAPARVLMALPLRSAAEVSRGIVNYVIRTSELVLLADPALHGKFRNDPYVRSRRPKSVLCAPIVHKGKLMGILYLENNQLVGAFTPNRLEAISILSSQIAVSIENATLYSQQDQQRRAIEAANLTLTKEIAERKRAEEELSRYKDHLEELVKARTKELENAQGRLVDLSRRAGMAEVASGVLHNVGNVMNSVNVGASVARDAVKALPVDGLVRACDLLDGNFAELDRSADGRHVRRPQATAISAPAQRRARRGKTGGASQARSAH